MVERLTEEQRRVLEHVWSLRPFVVGTWVRRGNVCSPAVLEDAWAQIMYSVAEELRDGRWWYTSDAFAVRAMQARPSDASSR